MKIYKDVKSKLRPIELDLDSSCTAVYVNYNIRTEEICAGHVNINGEDTALSQTMYVYDSMKYTREEWILEQLEAIRDGLLDPIIDPTSDLDTIKALKCIIIKNACNRKITPGIDVETTAGIEHFSLSYQDQFNIENIMMKVILLGMTKVVFNSDSSFARLYTNHEFLNIAVKCREFILRETTYCNFVCNYINSLAETDRDTLLSFKYGDLLPIHLDMLYNEMVDSEIIEFKQLIKDHLNIDLG